MKYFKDHMNKVYAYPEDGSQDHLIKPGLFGVTEAEAVSAANPPPSSEEIIANLTVAVQAFLDASARTRNYDGILSLCSYAASAHPKFGAEGLAGVAWRDAVWASCYAILADVQANNRPVPTPEALLAELPEIVWPG